MKHVWIMDEPIVHIFKKIFLESNIIMKLIPPKYDPDYIVK